MNGDADTGGSRAAWLAAAAGVAAVLLAANHDLVLGTSAPLWDADMLYAPYQMLVADHARAGRLLTWNPWTLGGSPDFAEPQSGAFSPLAVAVGAVTGGSLAGFRAYWLLVWLAGGAGFLCLARHLRATPWGAFVVTTGFLFSGLWLGHASHTSYLSAFAFLPWIVWRLDVAVCERRLWPAVEAGALWGLSGLSGYPAMTILSPCYAAAWALGRVALPSGRAAGVARGGLGFAAVALAVTFAVGAVVVAPPYVGLLTEGAAMTPRIGPRAREVAIGDSALHPGALLTFASPYLASLKLSNPGLWPYTDVTHASVAMGALVPALALFALAARPRDGFRVFVALLAASGIALSLGQTLPFRGWLYDVFPPSRVFRHAGLFRNYALFLTAVLALAGSRDLARALARADRRTLRRFAVVTGLASGAAVVAFYGLSARVLHAGDHPTLARAHLWLAWGGACAGAAAFAAGAPYARAALAGLALLAAAEPFFARALAGTVATADAGVLERSRRIDAERTPSLDLGPRGLARELAHPDPLGISNQNVPGKRATLYGYTSFTNPFHEAWVREPALATLALQPGPGARAELSRLAFAREAPLVRPTRGAFDAFRARATAQGRPPLLRHTPDAMPGGGAAPPDAAELAAIAAAPPAQRIGATVVAYRPDTLVLRVDAPSDGFLLVTDRWTPAWEARVDGRPAPLWPADFLFRAVAVHGGANEIELRYRPALVRALGVASASLLGAVALGSLFVASRGTRSATTASA